MPSIAVLLLLCVGCQTPPRPMPCGELADELKAYTKEYHLCLEDKGVLRHELKACQERR
jgi:hypothetical protein